MGNHTMTSCDKYRPTNTQLWRLSLELPGESFTNITFGYSWDAPRGLRHHDCCKWPGAEGTPDHQQQLEPCCLFCDDRLHASEHYLSTHIRNWHYIYAIIIIIIIIIRHQVHITQDTYRVTTIKRAMPERGREVGNPLVSLLLVGSSSHTDNAQWRSYCILPGYPKFISDTMSHKNDVIDWTWAKIWSHGPWYCRLGKHGLTLLPAWIFL